MHDLPKKHYDCKAPYDTIMADEDLTRHVPYSCSKTLYESKLKYRPPRSPTYSLRQSPYYEASYKSYDKCNDRDNVFSDVSESPGAGISATKLHQKWLNVHKSSEVVATAAYSPLNQNSVHLNEMSPSRSRRQMFREHKYKMGPTVPLESSFADDISMIVEDSTNGYKNDEGMYREIPLVSLGSLESTQHINWNLNSIPESDLFQF